MGKSIAKLSYWDAAKYSLFGGLNRYSNVPTSPVSALIIGVIATEYGFDLVALGGILAFLTVLDIIWDPAIGNLSDTWRTRWGQRRPWIIAGSALTVVTGLMLFYPRDDMSLLYFVAVYGAFNLSGSMYEVPYDAMATSITRDVDSRNRLYFVIPMVSVIVGASFTFLPRLPIFETTKLTVHVFTLSMIIFAVFAAPAIWILFRTFPEKYNVGYALTKKTLHIKASLSEIISLVKCNRPFAYMLALRVISGIGMAGLSGLWFFWFDGYLDLGAHFTIIMLPALVLGLAAPMAGIWLTKRYSRLKVYIWASILSTLANSTLFFLTPDTPFLLPIFVVVSGIVGTALSLISAAISHALFADVVDYGRLKARVEGAGLYISIAHTIGKAEKVLLGSIGLVILGLFGFQPGAESQPDQANMALRLLVTGLPSVTSLIAAVLMVWFPLNKRRMQIINRRLTSLNERQVRDLATANGQ